MKYLKNKGEIDLFILSIIFFVAIVLIGGVFFVYKTSDKPMQTYTMEDEQRPKIVVDKVHIDFGNIQISDTAVESVVIENTGQRTLQISNIKTSCGCTTARLEINGEKSPVFSMHNNPTWTGEIEPGQKGALEVVYEPSKMPVQGDVERTVFFKTNDPEKSEVNIHFTANVS